jgi:hypothetical protein
LKLNRRYKLFFWSNLCRIEEAVSLIQMGRMRRD